MKDILLVPGMGSASGYLGGKIIDGQTLSSAGYQQDMVQFFQKLIDFTGITPNGLFDNEFDGNQLFVALFSTVRKVEAAIGTFGCVDVANQATALLLADTLKAITPDTLGAVTGGMVRKKLAFSGWDMDTTAVLQVVHSEADSKKIHDISVMVTDNGGTAWVPLNSIDTSTFAINGGVASTDPTHINLVRATGLDFDSTSFNNASGVISYWYEV